MLNEGDDYTVVYENNTAIGTAYATVTFKGKYAGTVTVEFDITKRSVTSGDVKKIKDQEYTGEEITPKITVNAGGRTLVKGTDYTVSYKNNIEPGTATAIIAFQGNYTGYVKKTFNIIGEPKTFSVEAIPTQTYTGSEITPAVTVMYGDEVISDYTVSYENNINAGTATANITLTGKYSGTLMTTFA
ncbi:MAG: hypothetical protein KBS59_04345, partial [Clostridiales bacterium]|nr:hypothetical protein [Clostridiales bacterium]